MSTVHQGDILWHTGIGKNLGLSCPASLDERTAAQTDSGGSRDWFFDVKPLDTALQTIRH